MRASGKSFLSAQLEIEKRGGCSLTDGGQDPVREREARALNGDGLAETDFAIDRELGDRQMQFAAAGFAR